jgi:probable rRNA maturation factor
MIGFFVNNLKFSFKHKQTIKCWIKNYLTESGYKVGEINIIFCSDSYLLDINKKFLSHDYFTDIITFDYSQKFIVSGELYISMDTVFANSLEYKQPFVKELYRVIIHGILHMTGYNDSNFTEQNMIHCKEDELLERLNISSLGQSFLPNED